MIWRKMEMVISSVGENNNSSSPYDGDSGGVLGRIGQFSNEDIGDFYMSGGRFVEAVEFYSRADRTEERSVNLSKKRARAELLCGNALSAHGIFMDVLERAHDDLGARIGAIEAAVLLGNYPAAVRHLEIAETALQQTRDAPAARLGAVCRVLVERLGEPVPVDGPPPAEAAATGWDVRQSIERLKRDRQEDDRSRAAMLLLLKAQAATIEHLKTLATALFRRLQQTGQQTR